MDNKSSEDADKTLVEIHSDSEAEKSQSPLDDVTLANKSSPSNTDLMAVLQSMQKQQCTKADLSKLEEAMTNKIDIVKSEAAANKGNIDRLAKRLDKLEHAAITTSYNNELQKQRLLKNNLTIMGIPSFAKESVIQTAMNVFKALNCKVSKNDIASAYRTKGKTPIIVVKLSNYEDKLLILNAKAKKTVRVSDIAECDRSVANDFVFINNHVTPYFGNLLKEGRSAVKSGQIHSCWLSSSGCVFRFEEESDPVSFNTVGELQKAIKNGNANPSVKEAPAKRMKPEDQIHVQQRIKKPARFNRYKSSQHK